MVQGRSRMPNLLSGFVRRLTRWRSHFVSVMTAAKPIEEQITMMSEPFVIDLSNCWKAAYGSSERSVIKRPEVSNTNRVS